MPFSFDTNLVIGLVNETDRLHQESERIFHLFYFNRKEQFVCSLIVLKETIKVSKTKINKSLVDMYPIIPKLLEISDSSAPEFQAALLGKINELKKRYPNYSNFYNWIYKLTMDFFKKGGEIKRLPNFFSELEIDLSKFIVYELSKRAPEWRIIGVKEEHWEEVMKIMLALAKERIQFKDSTDGEIFYEMVLRSKEFSYIIFISDDEEFIKNANIAKSIILKLDYDGSKFSFTHISEIEN